MFKVGLISMELFPVLITPLPVSLQSRAVVDLELCFLFSFLIKNIKIMLFWNNMLHVFLSLVSLRGQHTSDGSIDRRRHEWPDERLLTSWQVDWWLTEELLIPTDWQSDCWLTEELLIPTDLDADWLTDWGILIPSDWQKYCRLTEELLIPTDWLTEKLLIPTDWQTDRWPTERELLHLSRSESWTSATMINETKTTRIEIIARRWVYLAPQNIPSAVVLGTGNQVALWSCVVNTSTYPSGPPSATSEWS